MESLTSRIVKIQDLKKGNQFEFNGKVHTVKRKFIISKGVIVDTEMPLITTDDERFYFEGLEVKQVMIKYWLVWVKDGKKHSIDVWHYSAKECEKTVLSRFKPKAITYEQFLNRNK